MLLIDEEIVRFDDKEVVEEQDDDLPEELR